MTLEYFPCSGIVGDREELVAPILEVQKRISTPQGISIVVTRPGQPAKTTNFANYGDALAYLTNIEFSEDEPEFHVKVVIKHSGSDGTTVK